MHTHQRTTFARYPYLPAHTPYETFISLILSLTEEAHPPRYRLADLRRHVLAIDVRRFEPEQVQEVLASLDPLSPSLAVLEVQLAQALDALRDTWGDPTCWPVELRDLPPLLATDEQSP